MKCTTYYFRPLGLLLLLCLIPLCSIAQDITVKGIVKDNLGESVIGANVTEKGTTNGMITDLDGNFSLTVQKNATLVISYIWYVTQEIAIKGYTNLYTKDIVVVNGVEAIIYVMKNNVYRYKKPMAEGLWIRK